MSGPAKIGQQDPLDFIGGRSSMEDIGTAKSKQKFMFCRPASSIEL
jgi:hypothetical protein